jgi:5-(carboxyamino)imidazole ribonucleotide synthase
MLALAGYPLGLEFRFFDPAPEAPAGQLAELVVGDYQDRASLAHFARGLNLLTYEFENVPVSAVEWLAGFGPVYPPPRALEVAQDRVAEKTFMQNLNIPTPLFYPVLTKNDLQDGIERTGLPCMLKTRRLGYDGKGQFVLRSQSDLEPAWSSLGGQSLIVEAFVAFDLEVSILAVRSRTGEMAFYPLVENHHAAGILRKSLAPAQGLPPELQTRAETYARAVMEQLNYVGVLAIELFLTEGRLLVNEMAPRVHNSGHWTIEAAETSQFENHLRAVLGLPLGSTAPRGYAAMLNLIGIQPEAAKVLRVPGAHLHWYGKEVRPGRKVGHVTLRADARDELEEGLGQLEWLL